MLTGGARLAVWGDPIAHSVSPRLHAAAYTALGLDWQYGRRQVGEADFAAALASLDGGWHGLSLTMPLKRLAAASARTIDEPARLTGAVNTMLFAGEGPRGFNTDVGGLTAAIREDGIEELRHGRILGAGATAASALVSLAELGARHVDIVARRPEAVAQLAPLGEELGVAVAALSFGDAVPAADVTVSALPGGTDLGARATPLAANGGLLVDVVYGTWPTPLAIVWEHAGGEARSGRGMLLHQALRQVRIFVNGSPSRPLEGEPLVLAAMREAVMGD